MDLVNGAQSLGLIHLLLQQSGDKQRLETFERLVADHKELLAVELPHREAGGLRLECDPNKEVLYALSKLKERSVAKLKYVNRLIEVGEELRSQGDSNELVRRESAQTGTESTQMGTESPKITRIASITSTPEADDREVAEEQSAESVESLEPQETREPATRAPETRAPETRAPPQESSANTSTRRSSRLKRGPVIEDKKPEPPAHTRKRKLSTTTEQAPAPQRRSNRRAFEWCTCRIDKPEAMIECEKVGCPIGWYHESCGGLNKPIDSYDYWMCNACLKKSGSTLRAYQEMQRREAKEAEKLRLVRAEQEAEKMRVMKAQEAEMKQQAQEVPLAMSRQARKLQREKERANRESKGEPKQLKEVVQKSPRKAAERAPPRRTEMVPRGAPARSRVEALPRRSTRNQAASQAPQAPPVRVRRLRGRPNYAGSDSDEF